MELLDYLNYEPTQPEREEWLRVVCDTYEELTKAKETLLVHRKKIKLLQRHAPQWCWKSTKVCIGRRKSKTHKNNYAEYLSKERARYHKRKAKGEIKLASEMTDRERRNARRCWRVHKQRQKNLEANTPPPSPSHSSPFRLRLIFMCKVTGKKNRKIG